MMIVDLLPADSHDAVSEFVGERAVAAQSARLVRRRQFREESLGTRQHQIVLRRHHHVTHVASARVRLQHQFFPRT